MGIGIDVGMKQDYSYLFDGLSGGSSGNLNFLSDYASIKNGSYGKLLKSYYGSQGSTGTTGSSSKGAKTNDVLDQILREKMYPKVSKEAQKANSDLTSGITKLTNTVAGLQSEDTYKASEDGTSAADKVISAVKDYVSQYNDVVTAAKDSTMMNKTAHVAGMMRSTETYADKLAEIGITLNEDRTLSLNEDKLKAAGISKVQELFSKDNVVSYGSTVGARLGFAGAASEPASAAEKAKEEEEEKEKDSQYGPAGLKEDIEELMSESLFGKTKDEDGKELYDLTKIMAAVKSFVGNYNSVLDAAGSSYNSGVISNLVSLREKTGRNASALGSFGISVDAKGKLSVNEDVFKKADMSKFKGFFKEYGSSIKTPASLINYYMTTQADASDGYTAAGTYNVWGNTRYNVTL